MLHQLPPELAAADRDSRHRWSVVAAIALVQSLSDTGLLALVAAGEAEFCRIARRDFATQDFRTEDFRRMFRILTWRAQRLAPLAS